MIKRLHWASAASIPSLSCDALVSRYLEELPFISVTESKDVSRPSDLLQGTLDLLLLKMLALEPLHGWAISQRLKQVSGDVLQVSDGSLYPALHKLEQEGWITAEWKTSELGRRAKFYSLTRLGRKQLQREQAGWERLSHAIATVLRLTEVRFEALRFSYARADTGCCVADFVLLRPACGAVSSGARESGLFPPLSRGRADALP